MGFIDTLKASAALIEKLKYHYIPPFDLEEVVEKDAIWMAETLSVLPNWGNGVTRWPLDNKYYLCSLEDMQKIVAWDWVDAKEYIRSRFDCEDFVVSFKAHIDEIFKLNQVGIVLDWSSEHSYNLIVLPDKQMLIMEPQTDQYWALEDRPLDRYALEWAGILI